MVLKESTIFLVRLLSVRSVSVIASLLATKLFIFRYSIAGLSAS